ncbi:MAG TPA: type III pantothenate kinase [Steroidobacteraceae bacterium]|nr:type III pantothenate kinase [Steroidobacteraceae bacterium]
MILLLDIGNTRIKWAQALDATLTPQQSLMHRDAAPDTWTRQLFRERFRPARLLVSNVAGEEMAAIIRREAERNWHVSPEFAATTASAAGVTNAYPQPSSHGVDRWLTLLAARHMTANAACVIDAGTAVTIDAMNARGLHLGGVIIPGIRMMVESLVARTSDLGSKSRKSSPRTVDHRVGMFASDTARAIESGALFAIAAAADRGVAELLREGSGDRPSVYLTGGDAERIRAVMTTAAEVIPDLVLRGLAVWGGCAASSRASVQSRS